MDSRQRVEIVANALLGREQPLITDDQQLDGAKTRSGYEIQTYDDGFGPLWISRNSIGINGMITSCGSPIHASTSPDWRAL